MWKAKENFAVTQETCLSFRRCKQPEEQNGLVYCSKNKKKRNRCIHDSFLGLGSPPAADKTLNQNVICLESGRSVHAATHRHTSCVTTASCVCGWLWWSFISILELEKQEGQTTQIYCVLLSPNHDHLKAEALCRITSTETGALLLGLIQVNIQVF